MREQRLENTEPLGRDRPDGTLAAVAGRLDAALPRRRDALALVRVAQPREPVRDGVEQGLRLERDGAPVLAQDPAGERLDPSERRLEDAVLERAGVGERSGDPPGGVVLHGDAGRADLVADLPRPRDAVRLDVELGREPEVALAPGREADVAADARDAERPHRLAVEILADDVPDALVETQRVRVQRPLRHLVPQRRPVRELDRALLRDRGLELREPSGELGRVVGRADADALGGVRAGVLEAGPPEREVLEGEPERLRVGELAVEVEERGLQRRELVVLQVEPVEEVVLGAERVELLARELVALGVEGHPERRSARPGRSRTGARTPRRTSPSSPRHCPSRRARSAVAAPPSGTRRGRAAG